MRPPTAAVCAFTTSMPTPRPDTADSWLAVLKPELQYWEYAIRQQFAGGVPDTSTAVTTR